jgi:hypothetical protein
MMKRLITFISIGIVSLLGACSQPGVATPSSLTIVPGAGVSNVVALGMTLREVAHRTKDYEMSTTHNPDWFGARIQSLGISLGGPYRGKNAPYYGFINFHVVPSAGEPQGTFTGYVEGGISFADTAHVRRDDIVSTFGSPQESITSAGSTNAFRFLLDGISYSMLGSNHTEVIYYPADGIMFEVQTGLVIRVAVYPKRSGRINASTLRR